MNKETVSNEKPNYKLIKRVYETMYQIYADKYKVNIKGTGTDEEGNPIHFEIKCISGREEELLANQS